MKAKGVLLKTIGGFSTAATSKMELFGNRSRLPVVNNHHHNESISDVAAALGLPLYADILYNAISTNSE